MERWFIWWVGVCSHRYSKQVKLQPGSQTEHGPHMSWCRSFPSRATNSITYFHAEIEATDPWSPPPPHPTPGRHQSYRHRRKWLLKSRVASCLAVLSPKLDLGGIFKLSGSRDWLFRLPRTIFHSNPTLAFPPLSVCHSGDVCGWKSRSRMSHYSGDGLPAGDEDECR